MSRTVSLLNRFGSSDDPETSNDPRIRALVSDLSHLDYAPAPRAEFRNELRAQLVAIAERVVAEGEGVQTGPATIDATEAALAARTATVTTLVPRAERRRRSVVRPLGLAAACCAVLALGLGGAVWKSRSALPGDSLYGLKRTSEDVQLSLASGKTDRGHDYLELASTRVQEARDLLGHNSAMASGGGVQAGGISPSTVALIQSTLSSANTDVTSGSTLLGTQAVQSHSANPLAIMTHWAPSQLHRLSQLERALGNGPARASTLQSWTLVHSALHRARSLQSQVGSHCAAVHTDEFGPTGCTDATHPAAPPSVTPTGTRHASSRTGTTHSGSAKSHPSASGSANSTHSGTHAVHQHPARSHSSSGPADSVPTTLPTSLPTTLPTKLPTSLPTKLPKAPVSVSSCGLSAQIGPIGVHVGSCPTSS